MLLRRIWGSNLAAPLVSADPWLFFGIDSSFMLFAVAVLCVFQVIAWPSLFKDKSEYERVVYPGTGYSPS
jgi:hypothetical protein